MRNEWTECHGAGKLGEEPTGETIKRSQCGVQTDNTGRMARQNFGQAEGDGGTRGMPDDCVWPPPLVHHKRNKVIGDVVQSEPHPSGPRESLAGQIRCDQAKSGQMRSQ